MPSRRGIGENLIAAGIWTTVVWLIHRISGLATGWTILLIVAGIAVAVGLLLLRSPSKSLAAAPVERPQRPRGISETEHLARRPATQEAARQTLNDLVVEEGTRVAYAKGVGQREAKQLPSRLPTVTPADAAEWLAEVERLEGEAELLTEEAWNRELKAKRTMPFAFLGKDFIERVTQWNLRVHALADNTMSVKERSKVALIQPPLSYALSGFGLTAERVEEVIRDNQRTLRVIEARCRKAEASQ